MPRRKRTESSTGFYHWINRGVNQRKLFHKSEDFKYFLSLVSEHKNDSLIELYHYCLMNNHIHLLLKAPRIADLAKFSQYIQRRYTYYYCRVYRWKGQLFQRMYKSLPIQKDEYLLECGRYIERNPVRARLVSHAKDYPYSSYGHYAFGNKEAILVSSPAYMAIAHDDAERRRLYQEYVETSRAYEAIVDGALLSS